MKRQKVLMRLVLAAFALTCCLLLNSCGGGEKIDTRVYADDPNTSI